MVSPNILNSCTNTQKKKSKKTKNQQPKQMKEGLITQKDWKDFYFSSELIESKGYCPFTAQISIRLTAELVTEGWIWPVTICQGKSFLFQSLNLIKSISYNVLVIGFHSCPTKAFFIASSDNKVCMLAVTRLALPGHMWHKRLSRNFHPVVCWVKRGAGGASSSFSKQGTRASRWDGGVQVFSLSPKCFTQDVL